MKYTMTIGLYLGVFFSVIVIIMKLRGLVHYPGDSSGMINTVALSMAMVLFGKKYRDTIYEGDELSYKSAFKVLAMIVVFSSVIYSFFSYWYYAVIEPTGISSYVEQMRIIYSQNPSFTEAQIDSLMSLFKSSITPGVMAFVVFFTQTVMGIFVALISAFFVKTPVQRAE